MDGVTWQEYGSDVWKRASTTSIGASTTGTYRAQPVQAGIDSEGRRTSMRPLGIAALEDKIVQQAVVTVLESDLRGGLPGLLATGFDPAKLSTRCVGCAVGGHHAGKKVNWVLDADIRGFFDTINHEWLLKFLEHRIADRRHPAPDPEMAQGGRVRGRPDGRRRKSAHPKGR